MRDFIFYIVSSLEHAMVIQITVTRKDKGSLSTLSLMQEFVKKRGRDHVNWWFRADIEQLLKIALVTRELLATRTATSNAIAFYSSTRGDTTLSLETQTPKT